MPACDLGRPGGVLAEALSFCSVNRTQRVVAMRLEPEASVHQAASSATSPTNPTTFNQQKQVLEGTGDSITVLSNGCLCCTVRDDLVAALNNLYDRRDEFDHIVIETTGEGQCFEQQGRGESGAAGKGREWLWGEGRGEAAAEERRSKDSPIPPHNNPQAWPTPAPSSAPSTWTRRCPARWVGWGFKGWGAFWMALCHRTHGRSFVTAHPTPNALTLSCLHPRFFHPPLGHAGRRGHRRRRRQHQPPPGQGGRLTAGPTTTMLALCTTLTLSTTLTQAH